MRAYAQSYERRNTYSDPSLPPPTPFVKPAHARTEKDPPQPPQTTGHLVCFLINAHLYALTPAGWDSLQPQKCGIMASEVKA